MTGGRIPAARRRAHPSRPRTIRCRDLDALLAEEEAAVGVSYVTRTGLQVRKWKVIADHLRRHPFRVSTTLPRDEQWRRVLDHVKKAVPDPTLIDWLIQQRQIAINIAAGVRDLRPRSDGPCYDVVLAHVARCAHKAGAVHRWAVLEVENRAAGAETPPGAGRSGLARRPRKS